MVTAAALARDLEVSERTVYRDIRDLVLSGVPIDGEAGVGYTLRKGFDLPPLMFTAAEIEALVLGVRVTASWAGPALATAANDALARIEAAVPEALKQRIRTTPIFAPAFLVPPATLEKLGEIRAALEARQKVSIVYADASGATTLRTIHPLGLFFWGATWSVGAWCELRQDFRVFRLDRVVALTGLGEAFPDVPGRGLSDFFASVERETASGG